MGCGVRLPQGLGIKAVVYEFLVLRIGESLFLQGVDNTYSTIIPDILHYLSIKSFLLDILNHLGIYNFLSVAFNYIAFDHALHFLKRYLLNKI